MPNQFTAAAQRQHGRELAATDLQHCTTRDDITWYMAAAKGNLTGAALHGYLVTMNDHLT